MRFPGRLSNNSKNLNANSMNILVYMPKELKEISVEANSKVGDLIKQASPATVGLPDNLEDQEVFLIDENDELPKDLALSHAKIKGQKAFVIHRCKKVIVTVIYQNKSYVHSYPPSIQFKHVRHDAIKEFKLDEQSSKNLELFAKDGDQSTKLTRTYPVGYLTEYPTCSVTVYLADPNAFAG